MACISAEPRDKETNWYVPDDPNLVGAFVKVMIRSPRVTTDGELRRKETLIERLMEE